MNTKIISSLLLFFFITIFSSAQTDREYWVKELVKMADPVLVSLSKDQLKEKMPVEQASYDYGDRSSFAPLEAFGRLMAGMAPWLELGADQTKEGQLRAKYIELFHKAIFNAVNPASKDFMNFSKGSQPLVDASFLAQAFLRAPTQLWDPLSKETKKMVIDAFKSSRSVINIPYNNWLLFAGTIEAFMVKFTDDADFARIEYALNKHMEWYAGDGLYSDGKFYHWDYYNSFVIHPMLIDIIHTLKNTKHPLRKLDKKVIQRAQRYGVILERQISPEGTFPVVGRSIVYRFGTFQALSQLALIGQLPEKISEGQVRAGLTAVLKRLSKANGLYDKNGWLQIGVIGHQPDMGEAYITTGSLYLHSFGFLPLGLPADHSFWTSAPEAWSNVKIWRGDPDVKKDHFSN